MAAADWESRWGAVGVQLQATDERHALRKMVELVFELPPGGFESLEPRHREIHLDNARTIPLLFASRTKTPITCDYAAAMEAERKADGMPNTTLRLVPGVDHQGPVTAPETIIRSILDFVDTDR